ncbi:subtilisin-like protease SBT4.3 [Zingiber officinale]|uniref:subtilisin-like protease SBT4.3 n=1 Tax=Zingiber officinale TaxID=94328 RepID=UPI001C4BD57D|nr:subtilisin-like protease SBT4.3 [Zingiber officinale]
MGVCFRLSHDRIPLIEQALYGPHFHLHRTRTGVYSSLSHDQFSLIEQALYGPYSWLYRTSTRLCSWLSANRLPPIGQVYIVYMGAQPSSQYPTSELHLNLLKEILVNCSPSESLVYSYQKSFNGFAAKLSIEEAGKLSGMVGIVSVFRSKTLKLRTTRSWDFINFSQSVNRNPLLESDVIIGMLDTGIWPESESFNDRGLGPPPKKWKGACINMTCNNKIIGARYYNGFSDYMSNEPSPRDFEGHGTHTASTAAGRSVSRASLYDLAKGTARGAVPSARLAVYKVCWSFGCTDQDILAAFDDAISDGVDVISLSLGNIFPVDYFQDSIAIGSFHAMANGILTSASAGNEGPGHGTVTNVAPWMVSAAASSIDRHIVDTLVTGDHVSTLGASVNTFATENRFHPFLYLPGNATTLSGDCTLLDKNVVKGKIVLCNFFSFETFNTGIKGLVYIDDSSLDVSFSFPRPAIVVSSADGLNLLRYINRTKNPVANILKSEEVFDSKAPLVASFSSRGPNTITPDILKPDISAPGIDILAAWSRVASPSGFPNDTRLVEFNIISGTSMACPHVTGAAAYVKSFHPNWSPAAIMSALMTTARLVTKPMYPSAGQDQLSYGAGQLNPAKAVDPGLVYDAGANDYAQMLCNSGYTKTMIRIVTGDAGSCSARTNGTARDLNYPSMALYVQYGKAFTAKFSRTVTNVGGGDGKYMAKVSADHRLNVVVNPSVLKFSKLNEKRRFTVSFSGRPLPRNSKAPATLIWSDGKHKVRSVMVVFTDLF